MMAPSMKIPPDPITVLEQRLAYRVLAYVADSRGISDEFTLRGLRGWMLCQKWPDPIASARLECLAVLSWTAICDVEAAPDSESEVRQELARQLDFLDGIINKRPATLDTLLTSQSRERAYGSLQAAAAPGSSRREKLGLPRFNVAGGRGI